MTPRVEISDSGRAGSVSYQEEPNTAVFDWELALSPALAVITGPNAEVWDRRFPWAAGRQAEIFQHVAREVVRQRAPGCGYELDLPGGCITVLQSTGSPERATLDAVGELNDADRKELVRALTQDSLTGTIVESLGSIDHPDAQAKVDAALHDHLSIDNRLAAAEVLHAQGRLRDLETFLAREIRMLNEPRDGLARALRLAAEHPTETVRQALLWASWNQTDCAPECARLLLALTGTARAPLSATVEAMLGKLGLHNSYFDRKAAFDALCQQLGMTLDEASRP